MIKYYLLLDQLKLLGLQKLLRHALWVLLPAETQRPELFAELGRVFVQEARELDLEGLDIWLTIEQHVSTILRKSQMHGNVVKRTYVARTL